MMLKRAISLILKPLKNYYKNKTAISTLDESSCASSVKKEDSLLLCCQGVNNSFAQLIGVQLSEIAHSAAGEIVKTFGSTYGEEWKKVVEHRMKVAEDHLKAGVPYYNSLPPVVADPNVPPGELQIHSGKQIYSMKFNGFPDKEEETIQEAVEERRKAAKWKIE
jgi:hypothetical protein